MSRKFLYIGLVGFVCLLSLVACGGTTATTPESTLVQVTPLPPETAVPPTATTEPIPTLPEPTIPPPTIPPPPAAIAEEIDAYIGGLAEAGDFSGAVLVARGDEVIFSQGYGLADQESGIANTAETRFRVTSLTKLLTATAIMQLQEQGKLKVTDAICDYLSDCPADWGAISIHQLLTHSSGISGYQHLFDRANPTSPADVFAAVSELPLDYEPGARSAYKHTGYVLLGLIIESASGQTYAEFIQENILDPIGMADSGFDAEPDGLAQGYLNKDEVDIDASIPIADGSLYSTVGDMFRLARALRTEQLVSSESQEAMFTPLTGAPWSPSYGLLIGSLFAQPAWGTGGGTTANDGYAADFLIFPDEQVISVVLSNQQSTSTDPVGEFMSRKVLDSE